MSSHLTVINKISDATALHHHQCVIDRFANQCTKALKVVIPERRIRILPCTMPLQCPVDPWSYPRLFATPGTTCSSIRPDPRASRTGTPHWTWMADKAGIPTRRYSFWVLNISLILFEKELGLLWLKSNLSSLEVEVFLAVVSKILTRFSGDTLVQDVGVQVVIILRDSV